MKDCSRCHYYNYDCPHNDYKINKETGCIRCSYFINEVDFVKKLDKFEKKFKIGQ